MPQSISTKGLGFRCTPPGLQLQGLLTRSIIRDITERIKASQSDFVGFYNGT